MSTIIVDCSGKECIRVKELESENAKMREALEKILEENSVVESYDPIFGEKLGNGQFAEIAAEALKTGESRVVVRGGVFNPKTGKFDYQDLTGESRKEG